MNVNYLSDKNKNKEVKKPQQVAKIFQEILNSSDEFDQDKEMFWVLGLTSRKTIKFIELVSIGTIDASLVHPRETFRPAIVKAVPSVIFSHNHPSGSVEPSAEDIETTKRLVKAGKLLGIDVNDHIIISKNKHCSMRSEGLII